MKRAKNPTGYEDQPWRQEALALAREHIAFGLDGGIDKDSIWDNLNDTLQEEGKLAWFDTVEAEWDRVWRDIGRKWMSPSGERTVIGVRSDGRRIVQDPTHALPFLVRPEELEREIALDERQHAAKARSAPPPAPPKPAAPEEAYAESFPPMQRAKVLAALAKFITVSGLGGSRGEHLRRLAAAGYRRHGDRIVSPQGAFYDLKAFGKTGGDYLDFLTWGA